MTLGACAMLGSAAQDLRAATLTPDRLAVIYNLDSAASTESAAFYAQQRAIPAGNVLGIHLPGAPVMTPASFEVLRDAVMRRLPTEVQSLALIWSQPYAVGCMSITTAFAAGYHAEFCEPGCGLTAKNPLFDADSWLPAETVGWWPAMLLPGDDRELARKLILAGIAADGSQPRGTLYLVATQDAARNVRAAGYDTARTTLTNRIAIRQLAAPVSGEIPDVLGYFTGAARVEELPRLHFRPGAIADHLTSTGGVLTGTDQTTVLAWLKQGATGSYGTVSEPCNRREKFPDIAVLYDHYLRGDSLLEAYWKSVLMPGQGLFVGEPLARPFGPRH